MILRYFPNVRTPQKNICFYKTNRSLYNNLCKTCFRIRAKRQKWNIGQNLRDKILRHKLPDHFRWPEKMDGWRRTVDGEKKFFSEQYCSWQNSKDFISRVFRITEKHRKMQSILVQSRAERKTCSDIKSSWQNSKYFTSKNFFEFWEYKFVCVI